MTTSKRFRCRATAWVLGAMVLTLPWGSMVAAYEYDAVAIPPLPGKEGTVALGINNAGQVVGSSYNLSETGTREDREAFIWDATNGVRALPTLSGESVAWDVNENGRASGYSYDQSAQQRAVWWDVPGNQITDIGTLTNSTTQVSGPTSTAYGINDSGIVVGNADIPEDSGSPPEIRFHAFLYDVGGGIQDLGTLTTAWPEYQNGYSIAYGINTQGDVVGTANDASFNFLPFVFDTTNGMQALAQDSNFTGEWYAVAINDAGLIAGHVIVDTNQSLPFFWQSRSATPTQVQMPAGFPYGEFYGINNSGQMVGIMWSDPGPEAVEHGFIFDAVNGVRDLNDLIAEQSGWVLTYARAINDQGQIVGLGTLNGQKRGFMLTQAPPPAATLLTPTGAGIEATPIYTWTAVPGATWYELWVNDSAQAKKIDIWYTAAGVGCAGGGNCTVAPSVPLAPGTATWWIQWWGDSTGYGTWSQGMDFTVTLPSTMATLVSPSGATTDTTPTYTWQAVPGMTWYYLWVEDTTGTKVQVWMEASTAGCGTGTGTCTYTPSTAIALGPATWWVQVWSPAGYGPWSNGQGFTVSGP